MEGNGEGGLTVASRPTAARKARRKLSTVELSGSVLHTGCECCPMCYATAYWARIRKIFYAAAWNDYEPLRILARAGLRLGGAA